MLLTVTHNTGRRLAALLVACFYTVGADAQNASSNTELALQLSNPVASLISLPIQVNYDENIGPQDEGTRITTNIQPVVPFAIGDDWNLISRTILPLITQDDVVPGARGQSGTGDILQSVFFSPREPTASGWIWGVGPAILLPTGSDDLLTADKWGVGPTAVMLRQSGPWTYGALANHIEDVAGDGDRADVSSTFLQPFLTYTTADATTFALNLESTYDWENDQAAVPMNFAITQVATLGSQTVSYGGGIRYWLESSDVSPEGFALRFTFTLLFPQ